MIEGAKWRRWVYFYIPLAGFILWLLFPFYWMLVVLDAQIANASRPWRNPNWVPKGSAPVAALNSMI